jgi:2-methylisocitrate lyase-like PEP mutase family enzyme
MMSPASQLRLPLDNNSPVVAPGAFNALFAKLIEEADFKAVYLSGAGVANSLFGQPFVSMFWQTVPSQITTIHTNRPSSRRAPWSLLI